MWFKLHGWVWCAIRACVCEGVVGWEGGGWCWHGRGGVWKGRRETFRGLVVCG
nr:MAG TPA: hypothetical protein [Caudoviricetes sp.]